MLLQNSTFQFIYTGVGLWANHMGQDIGAIGNMMGTHSEQGEKTELLPPFKKKNSWNIDECMLEISISRTVHHHFWLGLIPPLKIGVTLMGTHWELEGNKEKMKKILHNPPSPKLKRKINSRHFECMLSLPIDCMKFVFPKLFVTSFGLGQYPLVD
jgi:hypothetical protein